MKTHNLRVVLKYFKSECQKPECLSEENERTEKLKKSPIKEFDFYNKSQTQRIIVTHFLLFVC